MKPLTSITFPILALCINSAIGQWSEEVDSLINTAEALPNDSLKVARYGTLFEKLMFTDSDRAIKYAKLENRLATQLKYPRGIAASNLHFGTYHENIGQIDSARTYFLIARNKFRAMNSLRGELFLNHALAGLEKKLGNYDVALRYFERNIAIYGLPNLERTDLKDFNKVGAEYLGIAEIHREKGNYKIAVQEALKALKFFEGIGHVRRTGNSLKELGIIEQKRGNYENAISYSLRAYNIYKDHDYNEYQSSAAIDIGKSYLQQKKYADAIAYFEDALKMGRAHKFIDAEAAALINLGRAYGANGNTTKAKSFLDQSLGLYQELGFKNDIAQNLVELAKLDLDLENIESAIAFAEQAEKMAQEVGSLEYLAASHQIKSNAYELQNRPQMALASFRQFKKTTDSIFNATKSQQIEELLTIYETEKKEQQIAIQQNEIALLEQEAKINDLQRMALGGGLGLSLLVFGFGSYGLRQKLKRNKLEKEKVDAELAFKKKELTTHALQLAKKNETLESLKQKAKALKEAEKGNAGYQQLIRSINFDLQDDNNWQNFSRYFEEVHKDFNSNVKTKYPQVTSNELRLLALLKMNLSSKEIANILSISQEGIKKARYRLRKKLDIATEDSLQDLVLSL